MSKVEIVEIVEDVEVVEVVEVVEIVVEIVDIRNLQNRNSKGNGIYYVMCPAGDVSSCITMIYQQNKPISLPATSKTSVSTYDQVPLQTPSTTPVFNHGYDFAIPDDLLPFIPNGPLYVQSTRTKRTFIIPGSNRWFTEVRRLKRVHDAEEATKQRLIDETNQSKLLITSLKKIEQCVNLTQDLTRFQNVYHKHMTSFSERRDRLKKKKIKSDHDRLLLQRRYLRRY
ncbi:hypothetical protein RhiirA1_439477 [Rhizophagus irregularis]|uniref:Uncharacterized protein n=2 Tax=Rhizophagus irregularis TaxID=588596 RepID=A0A2N0S459_9GLOM|nr:hypothetical protein GLOIN_2v1475593 [Rhizophagus irregularis DAOM 181602=DAOM 197198]PKC70345.1 hypothetical protein RhiirA1_439477 [Rhizophagus irregularis]POG75248.1 hypothetical protein GLOIN_2v1475593 [Rhizophagus irregularis DAOM 181602=DAOM 197198]|eukprot:XP_025182114.1 hypothetical protein GLOIN_2v1475593 [Rhizophagus irregularis DAOM 181602=DAOM 197198]